MANAAQVARSVRDAIMRHASYINSQMAQASGATNPANEEPAFQLNSVLDYWKPAPDATAYPIIMINHVDEDYAWWAITNLYNTIFQFDVYGLVRGTDPETLQRAAELMAGAVKDTLSWRNLSLTIDDGTALSFVDHNGKAYMPITRTTYLESPVADNGMLTRGFKQRFRCSYQMAAPDEMAYLASVNPNVFP